MDSVEQAGLEYRKQRREAWRAGHPHWPREQPIPSLDAIRIDADSRIYEQGIRMGIMLARGAIEGAAK